jgi:hypothetical protein
MSLNAPLNGTVLIGGGGGKQIKPISRKIVDYTVPYQTVLSSKDTFRLFVTQTANHGNLPKNFSTTNCVSVDGLLEILDGF